MSHTGRKRLTTMSDQDPIRVTSFLGGQRRGAGLTARLVLFAFLWWVLSGGKPESWLWGLPLVLAAALVNPGLPRAAPWRWRVRGLLRFLPMFALFSLRSGADVGWRALYPRRALRPALVCYLWRVPAGPARLFLANAINLVPGTLSARIEARALTVHVLHDPERALEHLDALERRVAELFGVQVRP
ncbi:Na+/H+ antiporter subunit E [Ectothiorhodospiraceae bacterium 2226]|nr:Na+/H+ antiporter subunit E [Ectothiorhodospiraceae bacterium 2226]